LSSNVNIIIPDATIEACFILIILSAIIDVARQYRQSPYWRQEHKRPLHPPVGSHRQQAIGGSSYPTCVRDIGSLYFLEIMRFFVY